MKEGALGASFPPSFLFPYGVPYRERFAVKNEDEFEKLRRELELAAIVYTLPDQRNLEERIERLEYGVEHLDIERVIHRVLQS